jgi:hypothetical protein
MAGEARMTLGSHQQSIGRSQVAITPRIIIARTGPYDLDPCASDPQPWPCAAVSYTEADDGLSLPWFGRVFLNPPFDRRVVGAWIMRMIAHGHGTLLVHARTETNWFWPIWDTAAALLFLRRRQRFHQPDGSLFLNRQGQPKDSGAPVVLAAFGFRDAEILADCGLEGKLVPLLLPRGVLITALAEPTWVGLVSAFVHERGRASIDEILRFVSAHRKARGNNHVRAKLRQILNSDGFRRDGSEWVTA